MSGLQTIINNCNGLTIDRRKVVGIQFTRNEAPRTSLTPTYNPWRFVLDMPSSLRYYQARALLEQLDTLDRYVPQVVTFGSNPCLSWIFKYQGAMTSGQISTIRTKNASDAFVGNQLKLVNLPSVDSSTVLFEPNDLIQIGNKTFPFTSQTQVLRGSGSEVTVTTNRPNIITTSVANASITVGNSCQFFMFCPNMPTYKLVPGGAAISNGVTINNALIEFDDVFTLYEYVSDA
jgi:hypothetical protein